MCRCILLGGYSRGGEKSSGSGSGEQSTSAKGKAKKDCAHDKMCMVIHSLKKILLGHTVSHGKAKGKGNVYKFK